jgi:UDP-3-O-[3-hydroxymyristoyl] N-acetylglucosamine deacetylase
LTFTIDFKHPLFTPELCTASIDLNAESFSENIAQARTFGFLAEVEQMRSMNLALGGSLENAVVVDEKGVMNPEGLRYKDEFVRHKILDAVGDLYLLGHNILGAYTGYKSGHALNNQLCLALLAQPDAWEFVTEA